MSNSLRVLEVCTPRGAERGDRFMNFIECRRIAQEEAGGSSRRDGADMDCRLETNRRTFELLAKGQDMIQKGLVEEYRDPLQHLVDKQRKNVPVAEAGPSRSVESLKLVPVERDSEEYFAGTRQPRQKPRRKDSRYKTEPLLWEEVPPGPNIPPAGVKLSSWSTRPGSKLFENVQTYSFSVPEDVEVNDEEFQRALRESRITAQLELQRSLSLNSYEEEQERAAIMESLKQSHLAIQDNPETTGAVPVNGDIATASAAKEETNTSDANRIGSKDAFDDGTARKEQELERLGFAPAKKNMDRADRSRCQNNRAGWKDQQSRSFSRDAANRAKPADGRGKRETQMKPADEKNEEVTEWAPGVPLVEWEEEKQKPAESSESVDSVQSAQPKGQSQLFQSEKSFCRSDEKEDEDDKFSRPDGISELKGSYHDEGKEISSVNDFRKRVWKNKKFDYGAQGDCTSFQVGRKEENNVANTGFQHKQYQEEERGPKPRGSNQNLKYNADNCKSGEEERNENRKGFWNYTNLERGNSSKTAGNAEGRYDAQRDQWKNKNSSQDKGFDCRDSFQQDEQQVERSNYSSISENRSYDRRQNHRNDQQDYQKDGNNNNACSSNQSFGDRSYGLRQNHGERRDTNNNSSGSDRAFGRRSLVDHHGEQADQWKGGNLKRDNRAECRTFNLWHKSAGYRRQESCKDDGYVSINEQSFDSRSSGQGESRYGNSQDKHGSEHQHHADYQDGIYRHSRCHIDNQRGYHNDQYVHQGENNREHHDHSVRSGESENNNEHRDKNLNNQQGRHPSGYHNLRDHKGKNYGDVHSNYQDRRWGDHRDGHQSGRQGGQYSDLHDNQREAGAGKTTDSQQSFGGRFSRQQPGCHGDLICQEEEGSSSRKTFGSKSVHWQEDEENNESSSNCKFQQSHVNRMTNELLHKDKHNTQIKYTSSSEQSFGYRSYNQSNRGEKKPWQSRTHDQGSKADHETDEGDNRKLPGSSNKAPHCSWQHSNNFKNRRGSYCDETTKTDYEKDKDDNATKFESDAGQNLSSDSKTLRRDSLGENQEAYNECTKTEERLDSRNCSNDHRQKRVHWKEYGMQKTETIITEEKRESDNTVTFMTQKHEQIAENSKIIYERDSDGTSPAAGSHVEDVELKIKELKGKLAAVNAEKEKVEAELSACSANYNYESAANVMKAKAQPAPAFESEVGVSFKQQSLSSTTLASTESSEIAAASSCFRDQHPPSSEYNWENVMAGLRVNSSPAAGTSLPPSTLPPTSMTGTSYVALGGTGLDVNRSGITGTAPGAGVSAAVPSTIPVSGFPGSVPGTDIPINIPSSSVSGTIPCSSISGTIPASGFPVTVPSSDLPITMSGSIIPGTAPGSGNLAGSSIPSTIHGSGIPGAVSGTRTVTGIAGTGLAPQFMTGMYMPNPYMAGPYSGMVGQMPSPQVLSTQMSAVQMLEAQMQGSQLGGMPAPANVLPNAMQMTETQAPGFQIPPPQKQGSEMTSTRGMRMVNAQIASSQSIPAQPANTILTSAQITNAYSTAAQVANANGLQKISMESPPAKMPNLPPQGTSVRKLPATKTQSTNTQMTQAPLSDGHLTSGELNHTSVNAEMNNSMNTQTSTLISNCQMPGMRMPGPPMQTPFSQVPSAQMINMHQMSGARMPPPPMVNVGMPQQLQAVQMMGPGIQHPVLGPGWPMPMPPPPVHLPMPYQRPQPSVEWIKNMHANEMQYLDALRQQPMPIMPNVPVQPEVSSALPGQESSWVLSEDQLNHLKASVAADTRSRPKPKGPTIAANATAGRKKC